MIEISNLVKRYGRQTVLDIPQLSVRKGDSFGLVGNNGAGKTTMFRCILDLVRRSDGAVTSNGTDVAVDERWKVYTGSYLDEGFLIDFLTPEEYFRFVADLYKLSAGDLEQFYAEFGDFFGPGLLGVRKLIRELSSGNRQKIGIAAALLPKPSVVILDEPFNHLDPTARIRLKTILKDLNREKQVTLLISSHDLSDITDVCDRIVVLHEGSVGHDLVTSPETLKILEGYFSV
jgi:ABC-2 type transport system ATP-binding protein